MNITLTLPGRDINEFDLDSLNSASTTASSHDRHRSPSEGNHRGCLQLPEGPNSDGASDTASNGSSAADYTGPKLFVKPAAKSNRGIIINAINTVLAGAVNGDTKKKVLEVCFGICCLMLLSPRSSNKMKHLSFLGLTTSRGFFNAQVW